MSLSVRSISDNYAPDNHISSNHMLDSQIPNNQESNKLILPGLPREILYEVSSYLGPRDLLTLGSTCKTLLPVSLLDSLWKGIVARQCGQDYVDFLESTRFAKKELTTAEISPKTSEEISEESSNKISRETSEEIPEDTSMETSVEMKIPEIFKCAMAGYLGVMQRKLVPCYRVDINAERRFCKNELKDSILQITSSQKTNTLFYLGILGGIIWSNTSVFVFNSYLDCPGLHLPLLHYDDSHEVVFNKNQAEDALIFSKTNSVIQKLKLESDAFTIEANAQAEVDSNLVHKFRNQAAICLKNGDILTLASDSQGAMSLLMLPHSNRKLIPETSTYQLEKVADFPPLPNVIQYYFIGEFPNGDVLITTDAKDNYTIFDRAKNICINVGLNDFFMGNIIILADGNIAYLTRTACTIHTGFDYHFNYAKYFYNVIKPENAEKLRSWSFAPNTSDTFLIFVQELRNKNILILFGSESGKIFDQNGKELQDLHGIARSNCTETINEDLVFYYKQSRCLRWLKNQKKS